MADEEDIIIDDFKKKESLIHDDANWSILDTLLKKATAIDDYLKDKVGKQNRYTDLAKKKIAAIKAQYTALKNRMNQYKQTIEEYKSDQIAFQKEITELEQKVTESGQALANAKADGADAGNRVGEKVKEIETLTLAN